MHTRLTHLVLGLVLISSARGVSAQSTDTLIVGTYAYATVDRAGAVAPLAEHLSIRLNRPTRVVVLPDPVALANLVRRGGVDIVVTNTFGYLLLADAPQPAAVAVATFRVPPGVRTNYGTVIVSRDTAVHVIADLQARAASLRIALVAPGSTTGNLVPRLLLATLGLPDLEQQAQSVRYGGTHAATFVLLHDGVADVAALATEEYERQVKLDSVGRGQRFTVLWRSPDIALGPIAVRASLPAPLRDAIANAVVGLESAAPAAFVALRGGWTEARTADALIAANDRSYDDVRRLFGAGATATALIARFSR